jgi:hypothetical protein
MSKVDYTYNAKVTTHLDEIEIDVDDFVHDFTDEVIDALKDLDYKVYTYKEDITDELESEGYFVSKPITLVEKYKREWFESAIDKYSLEEFEAKFPV